MDPYSGSLGTKFYFLTAEKENTNTSKKDTEKTTTRQSRHKDRDKTITREKDNNARDNPKRKG